MAPVDILTVAAHAAQLIRSGNDPENTIAGAYRIAGLQPPDDSNDPLAVRIARLVDAAADHRIAVIEFLSQQAGPAPLNRLASGWGGGGEPAIASLEESDVEVEELLEHIETERDAVLQMMDDFPAFSIADRQVCGLFGGRSFIIRDGERLTAEEAGPLQDGDMIELEEDDLPTVVRGLIDYPLERPCLFTIEIGKAPWPLWDICCAFANQYARIYEQPEKYGVCLHDLSDLWIEELLYFPEKRLIYPQIGS